jgi:NADPH2:quinone reductase
VTSLVNGPSTRSLRLDILREGKKLAEAGKLAPLLNPERFTFETALDAHIAVESGTAVGKIVVEIDE